MGISPNLSLKILSNIMNQVVGAYNLFHNGSLFFPTAHYF